MKKDIQSEEDVRFFVDELYKRLLEDSRINRHFIHLDLEKHLPKVYEFWYSILLGTAVYKGNMIAAHQHLALEKEDFGIWLRHFEAVLRGKFEGEKMEEAISRANTIAMTMRWKILGV